MFPSAKWADPANPYKHYDADFLWTKSNGNPVEDLDECVGARSAEPTPEEPLD